MRVIERLERLEQDLNVKDAIPSLEQLSQDLDTDRLSEDKLDQVFTTYAMFFTLCPYVS